MKNFKNILNKEYWQSDAQEFVESRFKLFGFVMIILIVIFSYTILKINSNQWNNIVTNINNSADERQKKADEKLDSARTEAGVLVGKIISLEDALKQDSIQQEKIMDEFSKGFNEINKLKQNEKIIVTPKSRSGRDDFLSNYQFTPIR